jgi:hypothetical protein
MSYSSDEENSHENKGSCGCGNAICKNEIEDLQTSTFVTCSLCLQPAYCSEACRAIDWVKHDCPNSLIVPEKTQNMMVPYYFEDILPQQVLSSLEANDPIFQSYAFVHHGTDQIVTQWIQPPLISADSNQYAIGGVEVDSKIARGSDPRDPDIGLTGGTYSIIVGVFGSEKGDFDETINLAGTIPKDMIFAKNPNKKAAALAGDFNSKFVKDTQSLVFWPQVGETEPIPQYGNMTIELQVNSLKTISVTTAYDLTEDAARAGTSSRISKGVKKYFERRLKTKFPGKEAAIKYMITRHLLTPEGTQIAITFRALPREKTATIVDIEILVQKSQLMAKKKMTSSYMPPSMNTENTKNVLSDREEELSEIMSSVNAISVPIDCDPKNMSQVTGLIMALEMHMQDGENKHLADNAGIIRKYGRSLLDAKGQAPEVVPMEVNAAIHTAVNDLSEIGIGLYGRVAKGRDKFNASTQVKKFLKNSPPLIEVQGYFSTLLENIIDGRNKGRNMTPELADAQTLQAYARDNFQGRVLNGSERLVQFQKEGRIKKRGLSRLFKRKNKN